METREVSFSTVQQYTFIDEEVKVDMLQDKIGVNDTSLKIFKEIANEIGVNDPVPFDFGAEDLTNKVNLFNETKKNLEEAERTHNKRIGFAALALVGSVLLTAATIAGIVLAATFVNPILFIVMYFVVFPLGLVGYCANSLRKEVNKESNLQKDLSDQEVNIKALLSSLKEKNQENLNSNLIFFIDNEKAVIGVLNKRIDEIEGEIEGAESKKWTNGSGVEEGKRNLAAHKKALEEFELQVDFYKKSSVSSTTG